MHSFGQQPASTIVVPSRFCHGSTVTRAPLKGRCRRSAVAVKPARRASLLVYIYTRILKISIKNLKGLRNVRKSIETSGVISVL